MAVTDRDQETTTTSGDPALAASAQREPRVERLPYTAPRLRHLGSVRDLTLGRSNKAGEFGMRNM
jgi:hypothetical protein